MNRTKRVLTALGGGNLSSAEITASVNTQEGEAMTHNHVCRVLHHAEKAELVVITGFTQTGKPGRKGKVYAITQEGTAYLTKGKQ